MRLSSSHAASTNTSSSFRSGNKLFFAWSRRSRLSSTAVVYPILMVLAVVFAVTRWTRTAELTPNSTSYSWDHDNESKNSNHRSPPRLPATCKGKEKIWETLNRAIQNAVTDKGDPDGCSLSTTTLKIANTRTLRRHSRSSSSSSRKSINRKSQPFRKTPLSNQRSEYSRMHSSRSQTLTKTNKNRRQQQHTYGVTTCNVTDLCDQLPQLKQVVSLYGATPVVLGLETCAPYRALVAAALAKSTPVPVAHSFSNETVVPFVATSPRPVIRVAGLYNSGTNALTAALADNHFPHSFDYGNEYVDGTSRTNGSLWEVPWGKHVPPTKGRREASSSSDVEPALVPLVLPIVIVRDPFRWMSSMCKMNYDAEWMLVPHRHCPNLVSIPKDWDTPIRKRPSNDTMQTYKVTVHHTHQKSPQQRDSIADDEYDSLADMWSEYYNGYYHADFPRLIIRFEDMLFHRDYVMSQIAKCISSPEESSLLHDRTHSSIYSSAIHAPSSHARQWKYRIRNVKDHDEGHSSSSFRLVSAVIQYGTSRGRYAGMADEDLRYAAKALDATLMKKLHYKAGPTV